MSGGEERVYEWFDARFDGAACQLREAELYHIFKLGGHGAKVGRTTLKQHIKYLHIIHVTLKAWHDQNEFIHQ